MGTLDAVRRARAYFPHGLRQPEGGFRFAVDALLLAAFAVRRARPATGALLDLGCGCGVVGLACLLAEPGLTAKGVDILPEQILAARDNGVMLGLADRFTAEEADLSRETDRHRLGSGGYALVTANMPYRASGAGRLPRNAARQRALFAEEATMPSFFVTAGQTLEPGGEFVLVYPWETRDHLLRSLEDNGFSPLELLEVRTGNEPHSRCLVRAVRAGVFPATALRLPPPLDLHERAGGCFSEAAITFCPWLAPFDEKVE